MIKGFSTAQAERLLQQYGQNIIKEQKRKGFISIFIDQFNNFLSLLLLAAAAVSFFIGSPIDGGLIISIVILNAFFGIYQEKKASEAIAALKNMTISRVRTIRDGKQVEIDSHYLVPGDVIFIEEGSKVPADARVMEPLNLEVNEAALTGESLPIVKKEDDEVYMGTIVSRGRSYAEVINTGMNTKFGKIAAKLSEVVDEKTPLQKKMESLSRIIGIFGIVISVLVFILAMLDGSLVFPAFLLSISLAVAVVPEGLPAVMTITLAMGVKEMAKKKAIVRKLSSIEALGSITLIATDKTGTLTANKMKVKQVLVEDIVYEPQHLPSLTHKSLSMLILDGVLCSTASVVYVHKEDRYDILGDPTEGALLFLAQDIGVMPESLRQQWQLIEEDPFDSVTKKMSVTVKKDKEIFTFHKGALESILSNSTHIIKNELIVEITEEICQHIQKTADDWAAKGLRVLAFSYEQGLSSDDNQDIFLGMVAIHDPPRPESKEAIQKAFSAGIKVVMITGDNEKTAEAIGTSVGLLQPGDEILIGKQIEEFTDEQLLEVLPKVKIFARVTPFHKARIVKLYQKLGEIVAVTGDGVNDSIALKQANVGIAMGLVGTDVARETADMVITDDNFATIIKAIEEGRNIVKNLTNAIKYLLTGNLGEALALVVGLNIGIPQLFFPIQLLYTNLITDGIPALALAFSPREENIMKHKPQKKVELLSIFDKRYIFAVGLIITGYIIFSYYLFATQSVEKARTAAFTMVVCVQSFMFIDVWLSHHLIAANFKKLLKPIFLIAFFLTFILQVFIVSIPSLASLLKVSVLDWHEFAILMLIASSILIPIIFLKPLLRWRIRNK